MNKLKIQQKQQQKCHQYKYFAVNNIDIMYLQGKPYFMSVTEN